MNCRQGESVVVDDDTDTHFSSLLINVCLCTMTSDRDHLLCFGRHENNFAGNRKAGYDHFRLSNRFYAAKAQMSVVLTIMTWFLMTQIHRYLPFPALEKNDDYGRQINVEGASAQLFGFRCLLKSRHLMLR